MIPRTDPEDAPFPSPGQAIGFTIAAALLHGMLFLVLVSGYGARVALFGISAILAFGFVFAAGATRLRGDPASALGFVAAPTRAWFAVPFLLASVLLVSEIDNLVLARFPLPDEARERPALDGLGVVIEWITVVGLVLPAVEELFFRGLLQPGLEKRIGPGRAVPLVAALQGLASAVRIPQLLPEVTAQALVLGFLRHGSGSLLPCLLLAVLLGGVQILALAGAFGIPGFDDTTVPRTPAAYLLPAAVLVAIGAVLCWQAKSARDEDALKPPLP